MAEYGLKDAVKLLEQLANSFNKDTEYRKAADYLAALDKDLAKMQGAEPAVSWTPCTKGYPLRPGRYLVTTASFVVEIRKFDFVSAFGEGERVVAWQPLPEAHKRSDAIV